MQPGLFRKLQQHLTEGLVSGVHIKQLPHFRRQPKAVAMQAHDDSCWEAVHCIRITHLSVILTDAHHSFKTTTNLDRIVLTHCAGHVHQKALAKSDETFFA